MVNKNYFTSQDASYFRTNVFTKMNIMVDFARLPYAENTLCVTTSKDYSSKLVE